MADKKTPKKNGNAKTAGAVKKAATRSVKAVKPSPGSPKMNSPLRTQVGEKLHGTDPILSALIRHSPLAIICTDLDANIMMWNPMAEHLFGWSEAEVLGRKNPIIPREKQEEYNGLQRQVRDGVPYRAKELIRQRKDGAIVHVNASSAALRSDEGEVIALMGMFEDISERKRIEEALRESERRFRGAFESAAVGASMVDLSGRFIKVNRFLCLMLGYSEEELLSKTFSDITHPDDVWIGIDYMKRQIMGELEFASFEKRYIHKDGSVLHLIISPALIRDSRGEPQSFLGLFQNITERKKAEDALRESQNKFRTLFNSVNDSILIHDLEGRFLEVNEHICRLLGYSREELLRMTPRDIDTPEAAKSVPANLGKILQKGEHQFESEQLARDGRTIPVDISARVADFEGKKVIITVCRDITERKKTERRLRDSEEKYRELVETANSVILKWDTTGKIMFLNRFAEQFFGFTREELIGRNVVGTIVPPRESSGRDLALLMQEVQRNPDRFRDSENENITRDGRTVWIRWSNKAITDERGKLAGILSIGNDITAAKKAENELRDSRNIMEAVIEAAPT